VELKIERTKNPKQKPDQSKLVFGKVFTDHMFVMDYADGEWKDARIVPYAPIEMDPATMILHYGQGVFEGLKAYRNEKGEILLFRPKKNFERMNISDERLCIPRLDVDFVTNALKELVKIEADWVPNLPGTSLYIRPFAFATDVSLGVHVSHTYKFMIILSPVGAYYPTGLDPVKIMIENEYVRAARGGTGFTKAIANYAVSLKGQEVANAKGFEQVLWLDAQERKYVEEVGSMNVMFKVDGEIVTPDLIGTVLAGVTRDSVIQLLRSWGYKVTERRVSAQELFDAHAAGKLEEAFGTGTAAVISPIGLLSWNGKEITINGNQTGELSRRLYDSLMAIQYGQAEDKFGWVEKVK